MTEPFEVESTLTDRYQTTVPATVRQALKLGKRDKIHYTIRPDGQVLLSRANSAEEDDPVVGAFLNFLARDIERNPDRLRGLDSNLVHRVQSLVGEVEVDLDSSLSDEDE